MLENKKVLEIIEKLRIKLNLSLIETKNKTYS
jgi:hypothetical protein